MLLGADLLQEVEGMTCGDAKQSRESSLDVLLLQCVNSSKSEGQGPMRYLKPQG